MAETTINKADVHPKLRQYTRLDPNILIPFNSLIYEIAETNFFKPNENVEFNEDYVVVRGRNWYESYQKAKKIFTEKEATIDSKDAEMIKNAKLKIQSVIKASNNSDYNSIKWAIMSELDERITKSGYKPQPAWSVILNDLSANGELDKANNLRMLQNAARDLKIDVSWISLLLATAPKYEKDADIKLFANRMLNKWEAWSGGYAVLPTDESSGKIYLYAPTEIDIRRLVYPEVEPVNMM